MTGLGALRDRDDVAEREETIHLDTEEFETVRENVKAGFDRWTGAVVRDDEDRIVLVQNRWSDGWVLPGGDVEPDETFREAVVREVREETGLDVTVARPLAVVEQAFVPDDMVGRSASGDSKSGRSVSGHFVVFEARAPDPELGDDLGEYESEIEDAAWFGEVPDRCEHGDLVAGQFD